MTNPVIREDADIMVEENSDLFGRLEGCSMLVTGASGFLCSYLVDVIAHFNERHASRKIKLTAVDSFLAGKIERLSHLENRRDIKLKKADILISDFGKQHFDYIIHGASVASPVYYRRYPLETIDVNVNGTWRMLDLARERDAKAFLLFSSSEIYGDPDPEHIPTDENYWGNVSCVGPRACYDESKRLGETLTVNFDRQHEVFTRIVRPFNVYGPGQRLDDQRIIPDLMNASLNGGPIVLFSDGMPTRSFCYASDFIVGTLRVLMFGRRAEAYNIGNDEEISIASLAQMMGEIASTPENRVETQFQTSEDEDYLVDNPNRRCPDLTKAMYEVGYRVGVRVREGLVRTLKSYRLDKQPTSGDRL